MNGTTGPSTEVDLKTSRPTGGWEPSCRPRRPLVIVGLGNEIACDDGVGIAAARRLAERLAGRPDVEILELPWAGLALLDALAGRRRAMLIDSLATGQRPPGSVARLGEHNFRGSVRLTSFHDLSYPTALALGRRLGFDLPEDVDIWAIEGAVLDRFGYGLSSPVEAAMQSVVDEILKTLILEGASA